jgi:hypothetical protein
MRAKGLAFDPGQFDTRIQPEDARLSGRLMTGSLGSSWLEDVRDHLLSIWPGGAERLSELIARNTALASVILNVTGKSVFFDASKYPIAIRYLRRDRAVDLRVIHLVRDVRGASLSRRKTGQPDWSKAVRSWVRGNRTIERQLRRCPAGNWMRIRYEDLCREPQQTLNRLFEFCGVSPHNLDDSYRTAAHHIVGNRMRLQHRGQIAIDESWRDALTLGELKCAEKFAGGMHRRYGYPTMSESDLRVSQSAMSPPMPTL